MKQNTNNFLNSIERKIKDFLIPATLTEAINYMSEQIVVTQYNNGKTEQVDSGVEYFLCKTSPLYFLIRYAWIDFPGTGTIPFKLYYFQEEALKDFLTFRKVILEKTRQCLQEDNFVMTDRGYISIKNIKPGDMIETIINNKSTFTLVKNFYNQGKREICRILTNSGAEIKCTLDHKILTKNGWKEAQNITLKDEITSLIKKGEFGNFKLDDNKFAALIGYYLADGRSNSPSFVNTNINYINEVLEAGKLFENCEPYIYTRSKKENKKQRYDVRLVSSSTSNNIDRPVLNFLNRFGLNKKSIERHLTKELLELNEKQMSILLNRLYAGDGWFSHKKDKRRKNYIQYEIGLGSPDFTLIKQIEYILQIKYGIHCWVNKTPFNGNDFWKLRITQKKSVIDFINKIGIKGKTDTKKIINLISKENPSNSNQSFEKVRKIEYLKEKETVYDITTKSSNFLTNGLMVHNCGMSTLTSLYCFWRANFHEAEEIDVVSLKQAKAQAFVTKMDSTIKRLPHFLNTPIERNNTQFVKFSNGSRIVSESQSENAGRSDSLSLLVLDEASHYRSDKMVRGIIAASQPTLGRTGGQFIIISCLTKDTFIFTNNGIQQIEDILPEKYTLGFNKINNFKIDGLELQQDCNNLYYSGKSKTIKLKTNYGIEIEGTEIHPLMTIENGRLKWKQMKNFSVGDILAVRKGMNSFGNYKNINFEYKKEVHNGKDLYIKEIDNDLAYLFGIYLSEGYIYCDYKKQYKLQIAVTEQDIKNKIYKFCIKNSLHYTEQKTKITISSKGLIKLFEYIGFDINKKSKNKIITKKLLQMPKNLTIEMLKGMFDGDGYNNINSIDYSSSSIELIKQLRMILLNFGIITKTSLSKKTNVYSLCNTRYKELFLKEIGFHLERKQNSKIKKSKGRELPLFETLNEIVKKYKINKKQLQKKGCDLYQRSKRQQKNISEKSLNVFIENSKHLNETFELKYLINKNIEFITITEKEFNENETYDFTIPQTHSFLSNGIIGHNTPNGIAGAGSYYHEQVVAARSGLLDDTKLISIDWWEVPDTSYVPGPQKGYNKKLEVAIKQNYYHNEEIKRNFKQFFDPIAEEGWRDNSWLKKQMDDLQEVLYKQEVLHSFIVGEHQVFNEDILTRVAAATNSISPISKNKLGNNRIDGLWIWKNPMPKHRYIIGCLPPGEKILTDNGLKNIEKINFNDKLINEKGELTSIKNIQKYMVNENIYSIKIKNILRKTSFTGEHPILSSNHIIKRKHGKQREIDFNFKYKKVSELKKGDWLMFPNVYRKNNLIDNEILNKWDVFSGRKDFDLNKNIILSKNFWWFIGMWLAEGWTQNRKYSKSIHTCHNLNKEREYADNIKNLFDKYNRKVGFRIKQKCNIIETYFNSSQLFKFLNKNFGKYADKKFIAEWVKYLPEKFKIELIKGYLNGDGSIFISNNKYKISFVSVSFNLIESIQDMLFSIGIVSSLQILRNEGKMKFPNGKTCKTKKTYQLNCANFDSMNLMDKLNIEYDKKYKNIESRKKICHAFVSNDMKYIYLRINKIDNKQYKGLVYNFETESHNYLCKYLTTHNCDVSTGTGKDSSSIQVMDVENYEQVAEYKGFISTKLFGRFIRQIAKFYNQAFVVIECNGIGEAVFNEVYYNDNDPYQNVFKQLKKKNNISRMTGWITDVKTRKLLTNELIDWFVVDELWDEFKVYSTRLFYEMSTWIWDGSKPDHAEGCVAGNTLIETINGARKIEELKEGDLILTHKGNFKPIKKTFKFKDDSKQMLKIQAFGKVPLFITSNQEFYVCDKNTENFYFENFDKIYNYSDYKSNGLFSKLEIDIDKIDLHEYNMDFKCDDKFIYWKNKKGNQKINRYIELDKMFLFFIGHVLADGTISKKGSIAITTNEKEFEIHKEYEKFFQKYNIDIYQNKVKDKNYKRFSINNIVLWNFLKEIGISENKKIPKEFRYIKPEKQLYILMGYLFGDSCFNVNKETFTAASISSNLMFFIYSVLFRNNINFNMSYDKSRIRKNSMCKEQFKVSIIKDSIQKIINNDLFYLIREFKNNCEKISITKKSNQREKLQIINNGFLKSTFRKVEKTNWNDYFYDIEVEDDHSYVANGYIVHNSHDDTLIAMALCVYLRNKVEEAGESFLINDAGDIIEYDSKDNLEKDSDDAFDIFFSEEEDTDLYQQKHGMSAEEYKWIISK